MFLVNSRYRRFVATTTRFARRGYTVRWHTLSRSYGVNLPSSLTWLLSNALVFSTRPPESVSGTVSTTSTQTAAFLGSMGSITHDTRPLGVPSRRCPAVLFPTGLPTGLHRDIHCPADLPFSVPALLRCRSTGIFACSPSTWPFGCALGTD